VGEKAITSPPDDHQQCAPEQRLLEAQDLVREHAADEGEGVHEGLDGPVLQVGRFVAQAQLVTMNTVSMPRMP
jgi:hypothetical protein